MAENESDARSGSSASSTCGLEYGEDDSLSARNAMMVNNKWLSDVTFLVGPEKQRIYAHKLRLVTASRYFHILFFGNFAEAKLDEIELKDEDPAMFLTILRLIYGAHVDVDVDNIRQIYDRMQMYLLPSSCYKLLIDCWKKLLLKDTVMQVLRENEYYKFKALDEMCLRFVRDDPLHYFKKDDFTGISKEGMLKILGLQRINCTNDQLHLALEKWKLANPESDSNELSSVLDATLRTYWCDKICFVPNQTSLKDIATYNFSLKVKETPVILHGISIYLKSSSAVDNSGPIVTLTDLRSNEILANVEVIQRNNPCLELVDLMFEELELEEGKAHSFKLTVRNLSSVACSSYVGMDDENVVIMCDPRTGTFPVIGYLWVVHSEKQFEYLQHI